MTDGGEWLTTGPSRGIAESGKPRHGCPLEDDYAQHDAISTPAGRFLPGDNVSPGLIFNSVKVKARVAGAR